MNCLICRKAQTIDGFTPVVLERGETKYVVENVPAQICPECGDATVEADVADRLLRAAETRFAAGQWTQAWAYDSL